MQLGMQLVTQIAGGMLASYADTKKPEWTKHVGTVAVTPGMLGAVGVLAAAAFKIPLPGKSVLNQLAGGALIYEGVKLGEAQVTPRLEALLPTKSSGMPAFPNAPGYGRVYGPGVTQYELQQMMRQMPRAA